MHAESTESLCLCMILVYGLLLQETQMFKAELLKKLLKEDKDEFGDHLDAVIDVCAQIFSEFLPQKHGCPGTTLVEPFTDMLGCSTEEEITKSTSGCKVVTIMGTLIMLILGSLEVKLK